ncbi:MAG TPA: ABC transporter permease subunit [Casimicrobiaceae bacterium]|nr:ABC transporter permease subunit [Casimicrobiaceae bacterium]
MSVRWQRVRNALILIAGIVLVWQILFFMVGDIAISSPLATLQYTAKLVRTDTFGGHLRATLEAFGLAYLIAVMMGLSLGFWLGFHKLSGDVAEPMLVALYSIPKVTLYPILLLSFGLGLSAKVAFGVLHGVIPITLFTLGSVRNVRPIHLKTARALKLSPLDTVFTVLFPAALPEIVTGLRVGFALTLIGALLAEMFASQRGLGFLLMNAIGLHNVDLIMSITLLLVVFAATISTILLHIDRRLHHQARAADALAM